MIFALSFLGHWGDRKWMFTAGIILIYITPGSMRLIGFYYAFSCVLVIVLAAPLGSWIDRSPRLRAALSCLVVQNLCVAISAGCFLLVLELPSKALERSGLRMWLVGVAIVAAGVADVASTGTQTCLTKDWLVEVCAGNGHLLARSNAVIRAIDLGTEVLSPAFAGFVMTLLSVSVGAAIIAAWNLLSLCVEAVLYVRVWSLCPSIQAKKETEKACPTSTRLDHPSSHLLSRLRELTASWMTYMTHEVRSAGLALAFLYMTVLSFDNYARAYMFESGINEAWLGLITSMSSVPGLFGSLLFPLLRTKFGVERVGLLGFAWLSASLSLCVVSVFVPGSLFYLASSISYNASVAYDVQRPFDANITITGNLSHIDTAVMSSSNAVLSPLPTTGEEVKASIRIAANETSYHGCHVKSCDENPLSVLLLLIGMIVSRFGLWTADLSVGQSFQELVEPEVRGALNGVQHALNMLFSLLRSVLLIAFPRMDTFGFLIMLSFAFVFMGFMSYCHFYYQRRTKTRFVNRRDRNEAPSPSEEAATPLRTDEELSL